MSPHTDVVETNCVLRVSFFAITIHLLLWENLTATCKIQKWSQYPNFPWTHIRALTLVPPLITETGMDRQVVTRMHGQTPAYVMNFVHKKVSKAVKKPLHYIAFEVLTENCLVLLPFQYQERPTFYFKFHEPTRWDWLLFSLSTFSSYCYLVGY